MEKLTMMMENKTQQSRRTFLHRLANWLPAFLFIVPMIYRSAFSNQVKQNPTLATVKIADNPALASVGGFVLVKKTSVGDVLIVHIGNSQYAAMSDVCPHKQCRVQVKSAALIKCPCHGSAYKSDGTYVSGPSHKNLLQFRVAVEAGEITVTES
jgi:Rieske Fe-S protein